MVKDSAEDRYPLNYTTDAHHNPDKQNANIYFTNAREKPSLTIILNSFPVNFPNLLVKTNKPTKCIKLSGWIDECWWIWWFNRGEIDIYGLCCNVYMIFMLSMEEK